MSAPVAEPPLLEKTTKKDKKNQGQAQGQGKAKKVNRDGLEAEKEVDFPTWYGQVILKAELIDFYDISGCYILRPHSYAIWTAIQDYMNDHFTKKMQVQNAYFPLLVSNSRLQTEKNHVEGFAAEVAWITKSGQSDLDEPIAIRPTSETIMYPSYSKWIRSHRDLPLKLNQWSNVIRWEFKHPTPFLRTREFLWQEGHCAFATEEEMKADVMQALDLYKSVYEDLLAIPVIQGRKSEKEKFAGGDFTTTVEAFIPATGRAIQGATSHGLGQNFAKMFDIKFESDAGERNFVWQDSWGLTTRTIGVMVMVHGDNKGLVIPPKVAPIQIVVIPILIKGKEEIVTDKATEIGQKLQDIGLKVKLELRTDKNPGWKFNYYELKGVPLRVELGPRDVENNEVVVSRRDNGEKVTLSQDTLTTEVPKMMDDIHRTMYEKARNVYMDRIKKAGDWSTFMTELNKGNLLLSPWCDETPCEEDVKTRSAIESKSLMEDTKEDAAALSGSAKTLCKPFDKELKNLGQEELSPDTKCFACGAPAKAYTLWGRSY